MIITALIICSATGAKAQFFGIKSNVVMLPTGTVNLGVEVAVDKQWSLDISGYWNPIKTDNFSSKLWYVQPGVRYWLYEHFVGHFAAAHAAYGQYDVANKRHSVEGWFTGLGVSYGYTWIITKQWNFTLEGGLGIYYMRDTKYPKQYDPYANYCMTHYRRLVLAPSKLEAAFTFLF